MGKRAVTSSAFRLALVGSAVSALLGVNDPCFAQAGPGVGRPPSAAGQSEQPDPIGPLLIELAVTPEIARELDLSPEQTSALVRLRDDDRAEIEGFVSKSSRSSRKRANMEFFNRLGRMLVDRRGRTDEAIAKIVGDARFDRLRQLQKQAAGLDAYLASPGSESLRLSNAQRDGFRHALDEVDRQVEIFRRTREREALERQLSREQLEVLSADLGTPATAPLPVSPSVLPGGPIADVDARRPPPSSGVTQPDSEPSDLSPIEP